MIDPASGLDYGRGRSQEFLTDPDLLRVKTMRLALMAHSIWMVCIRESA